MTLALLLRPSELVEENVDAVAPPAAGVVGDALAFAGYVRRARVASGAAACGALVFFVYGAMRSTPAWWVAATLCAVGAWFDFLRARLAHMGRIDGNVLVLTHGPHAGLRLSRAQIAQVGFGAPVRGAGRAPETFWRGDFRSQGRSHLVVVRLKSARGLPARLILPEVSAAAANGVARALRAFCREERNC